MSPTEKLVPGVNVDPVDIEAGLVLANSLGYRTNGEISTVYRCLSMWAEGEEAKADSLFAQTFRHELTVWRRILAHAIVKGKEKLAQKKEEEAVITEMTKPSVDPLPGTPWEDYPKETPRRRPHERVLDAMLSFDCGYCGAEKNRTCKTKGGNRLSYPHASRYWQAYDAGLLPLSDEAVTAQEMDGNRPPETAAMPRFVMTKNLRIDTWREHFLSNGKRPENSTYASIFAELSHSRLYADHFGNTSYWVGVVAVTSSGESKVVADVGPFTTAIAAHSYAVSQIGRTDVDTPAGATVWYMGVPVVVWRYIRKFDDHCGPTIMATVQRYDSGRKETDGKWCLTVSPRPQVWNEWVRNLTEPTTI